MIRTIYLIWRKSSWDYYSINSGWPPLIECALPRRYSRRKVIRSSDSMCFSSSGKWSLISKCVRLCETGHEDFKATDSRDADWLIVRCSEGFDGGLPLTNYELEVYSEENVYHVNTIYLNHTDRSSSSGPVFEVPGLEPGRNYRLHLYAVNAKGRSDPVVLEPVTLKGVAMYTTGKFLTAFNVF